MSVQIEDTLHIPIWEIALIGLHAAHNCKAVMARIIAKPIKQIIDSGSWPLQYLEEPPIFEEEHSRQPGIDIVARSDSNDAEDITAINAC